MHNFRMALLQLQRMPIRLISQRNHLSWEEDDYALCRLITDVKAINKYSERWWVRYATVQEICLMLTLCVLSFGSDISAMLTIYCVEVVVEAACEDCCDGLQIFKDRATRQYRPSYQDVPPELAWVYVTSQCSAYALRATTVVLLCASSVTRSRTDRLRIQCALLSLGSMRWTRRRPLMIS